MQLKAVCSITMRDLVFKPLGQVDDLNGLEGAPLDAHTAPNTQGLGNEADLGSLGNFNALLSGLVDGARFSTLEGTLLGFALVRVDDCDS